MLSSLFQLLIEKRAWFFDLFLQHIGISFISIALAVLIGLSLGIAIAQWRRGAKPVLALVNFVYTIPSIALFGFLIPVTGIGDLTAIVALTVYALLPMVRNTYTGLTTIDPAIIEAARGMGSTDRQLLYRIELPLAAPIIMSGIRNMATMTIALAGIASFIGAGGLGVAIAYPQAKALHQAGAKVDLFVGFRNRDLIILEKELRAACTELNIVTDDGSNGRKGFVTDALREKLDVVLR